MSEVTTSGLPDGGSFQRLAERLDRGPVAPHTGVSELPLFQHSPDMREVRFDGESDLRAALMQAVAEASDGLQPLEILTARVRASRTDP
ncbi:hypothetical protein ACN6LA_000291 [Streptomyces sp. SAS_269]|uniref:hypothetical protein n=1 Tax=Streptomyces sp. SAS_269 TaxID=3412749 RepID=UPI00403C9CF9